MAASDQQSERSMERPGRSKRFQFSIGAIMLLVAVCAVRLGVWKFFQPVPRTVWYEITTVASTELDTTEWTWHDIEDSPYQWAMARESELPDSLYPDFQRTEYFPVSRWRNRSQKRVQERSVLVESPSGIGALNVEGMLSGSCGVRSFGGMLQLRIDNYMSISYPDRTTLFQPELQRYEVNGNLRYEGYAPEECLVFAAPLREGEHHLIIVRVVKQDPKQWK